jgi:hypothetical protein
MAPRSWNACGWKGDITVDEGHLETPDERGFREELDDGDGGG